MNRPRVLEDEEIDWYKRDRELFGPGRAKTMTLRSVAGQILSGCRDLFTIQKGPSRKVAEAAAHLREGLLLGTIEVEFPVDKSPEK
jgi:hypothetical protein